MLAQALESLIQQTLNKRIYEIIVVENVCTDNTNELVRELMAIHPECNITLIHEDVPGAGHARNKGLKYARGDIVAFMDDDAKAKTDWLETALRCFEEVEPKPIGIGGPIFPYYFPPKPAWFKDEYEIRTWGEQPRFLNRGEMFSGSNMIFQKNVLEKFGGFDICVEIKGISLILGEECTAFEKMWNSLDEACLLYYSPKLTVFHAVPNYKISVFYRLKRAFAMGQSWGIRNCINEFQHRLVLFFKTLLSISKSTALIFSQRKTGKYYIQNWIIDILFPTLIYIGRLSGSFGIYFPLRQRPRKK
jgi:glycosyltransferase involved in cell wall biosynthesis